MGILDRLFGKLKPKNPEEKYIITRTDIDILQNIRSQTFLEPFSKRSTAYHLQEKVYLFLVISY